MSRAQGLLALVEVLSPGEGLLQSEASSVSTGLGRLLGTPTGSSQATHHRGSVIRSSRGPPSQRPQAMGAPEIKHKEGHT